MCLTYHSIALVWHTQCAGKLHCQMLDMCQKNHIGVSHPSVCHCCLAYYVSVSDRCKMSDCAWKLTQVCLALMCPCSGSLQCVPYSVWRTACVPKCQRDKNILWMIGQFFTTKTCITSIYIHPFVDRIFIQQWRLLNWPLTRQSSR